MRTNMKTLSDLVFEAKFSNFNELELKAFADQLNDLMQNNEFLKKIANRRKVIRINTSERWAKAHHVPKSDELKYGNKYLLIFDNPFMNGKQLTLQDTDNENEEQAPTPCVTDEDEMIFCIAIADKFNKLHLVNQWGNDCTVQWRDKGMFLKSDKRKFFSDAGWYLYRKGFSCYYVNQKIYRAGSEYYIFPEKQKDTFVRLEDCVILDISLLPARFEEIQREIDAKAKQDEKRKKEEEERLRAEEESKKWWKEREGYKSFGCANGWTETPKEIEQANEDPDAKWYKVSIGRCYHQYFCDKYKLTYTVDSSD